MHARLRRMQCMHTRARRPLRDAHTARSARTISKLACGDMRSKRRPLQVDERRVQPPHPAVPLSSPPSAEPPARSVVRPCMRSKRRSCMLSRAGVEAAFVQPDEQMQVGSAPAPSRSKLPEEFRSTEGGAGGTSPAEAAGRVHAQLHARTCRARRSNRPMTTRPCSHGKMQIHRMPRLPEIAPCIHALTSLNLQQPILRRLAGVPRGPRGAHLSRGWQRAGSRAVANTTVTLQGPSAARPMPGRGAWMRAANERWGGGSGGVCFDM
jgi:hypothetical protein